MAHDMGRFFRLRTVLWILLTSVILNVLVAWGCLLWSPSTRFESPPQRADGQMPEFIPGPNKEMDWWCGSSGFGVWNVARWSARVDDETFFHGFRSSLTPSFYRCGWPAYSMQSVVTCHETANGRYLGRWDLPCGEIVSRGLQTSWIPGCLNAEPDRRLPLVPFWPGFALDTVFYFATLTGFSSLFRLVCRGIRQLSHYLCHYLQSSRVWQCCRRAAVATRIPRLWEPVPRPW
jgi:hypothetical protein